MSGQRKRYVAPGDQPTVGTAQSTNVDTEAAAPQQVVSGNYAPTNQAKIDVLKDLLTSDGALFNAVVSNAQMSGFAWVQNELLCIEQQNQAPRRDPPPPPGSVLSSPNHCALSGKHNSGPLYTQMSCCGYTLLPAHVWGEPGSPGCPFSLTGRDFIGRVPETTPVQWLREYNAGEQQRAQKQLEQSKERLL